MKDITSSGDTSSCHTGIPRISEIFSSISAGGKAFPLFQLLTVVAVTPNISARAEEGMLRERRMSFKSKCIILMMYWFSMVKIPQGTRKCKYFLHYFLKIKKNI